MSTRPWVEFPDDRRRFEEQSLDAGDVVPCIEAFRAQGNFAGSDNVSVRG